MRLVVSPVVRRQCAYHKGEHELSIGASRLSDVDHCSEVRVNPGSTPCGPYFRELLDTRNYSVYYGVLVGPGPPELASTYRYLSSRRLLADPEFRRSGRVVQAEKFLSGPAMRRVPEDRNGR